jgi:hypothetical protein
VRQGAFSVAAQLMELPDNTTVIRTRYLQAITVEKLVFICNRLAHWFSIAAAQGGVLAGI